VLSSVALCTECPLWRCSLVGLGKFEGPEWVDSGSRVCVKLKPPNGNSTILRSQARFLAGSTDEGDHSAYPEADDDYWQQRVESSHLRSLSLRGERGNHTIYSCELLRVTVSQSKSTLPVETPQDTRPPSDRRAFPRLSHKINVLIPISCPYVS
jgi:hypothetical protein